MLLRLIRWISGYEPITNMIQIRLRGRLVGADAYGNRYFRERGSPSSPIGFGRERRWVIYATGGNDGSKIPAEWHGWLHHRCADPLRENRHPWQLPHQTNLTGTEATYRPPGHMLMGGKRDSARGDYLAWQPGSGNEGAE